MPLEKNTPITKDVLISNPENTSIVFVIDDKNL
jgi:hypothetical protein